MIWNEYEAYVLQVKQIGTSACGYCYPKCSERINIVVINFHILYLQKALDYKIDKEDVCKTVQTNLRMEAAPVPYYLFSRSSAGAVPIATLNLQCGVKPGWTIPDAWHHQMVYGVSSKGVYLTNPLEIVQEEVIMEQLTSDSVLLVRRQDVVNRFRDWAPLNDILKQRDKRWQTMNVLGQVVNVLREACTALSHQVPRYRAQLTSHISIPAAYKAGVTLFVRGDTELCTELFTAPELELKDNLENQTSLINDFVNKKTNL
ncbi:hypothetical protein KUTeg_019396 [Tegillarca granosa]|uniref:Vitellogenin n=1 Tax=Tegillarca granosa TaxID=220873 RepID=A0ABQ9EHU8_TEGGR|nr:hypothetical protein KUTeg_019396 [Tegillarca granosa]